MVEVTVTPQSSLADRPVQMRVQGLSPSQLVTLRASLMDEQGECFQARAFFRADGAGEVDPGCHPALGGSYAGVWPMGLFWFLQPDTLFRRLVKRDVAGSPFLVRLEVFDGVCLVTGPQDQPLASCVAERWYVCPGMQRVPIREGRVRGALFLPPGEKWGTGNPGLPSLGSLGTPWGQLGPPGCGIALVAPAPIGDGLSGCLQDRDPSRG